MRSRVTLNGIRSLWYIDVAQLTDPIADWGMLITQVDDHGSEEFNTGEQ